MGGPVARLTGDRGRSPPTRATGWADADGLDENAFFFLARHRPGREGLFNPEDKLLYRFDEHRLIV